MTPWILIGFGLILLLIGGLWLVVPAIYGVPWVPTRKARIRRGLQLAELRPDEILYDLGAGDGRVLIMANSEFGSKAVGIEIGPVQYLLGWLRIRFSGSSSKVRLRCANLFSTDLSEADVVFIYLTSKQISRLEAKLERELRPGTRVVSIAGDFPSWEPTIIDREKLIYIYEMPPSPMLVHNYQ